jgi:hypothetical protein
MARDLFIDLTNRRLAVSETNSAPAGQIQFTKGDNGAFNLYFLEATGIINRPYEVVSQGGTVKFGIGSRTGVPDSGTYTLTFGGDTTSSIVAAATAGAIQTALNALSAISSAGGVTVTGELSDHFTVRFNNNGSRALISADVSQLIPDTVAAIDERIAGSASVKEIQEIQLRLTPAVYQDSWTDLSTTVTATIATTVTGSASLNEVQRLSFSQEPFAGTYQLTMPGLDVSVYADGVPAVTNGVFAIVDQSNHGLALNQPVQLAFNGTITGLTSNQTYFVRTVPLPYQFTVAATAGGTVITASAVTTFDVFSITRQTAPISAQASAADVQAALEALDSIGAGGVIVTGIPGEYYDITFSGAKGYVAFSLDGAITVQNSTTAKPGKTADVNFATFALRDLVGNNPSVDLDLEIEITESGARSTVVLGGCSVSEELIDADSFSPVVGYPSYIFQALTAAVTNATTSLVAITALNWTAQANSEYLVEVGILATADGNPGNIDGRITVPTGAEIFGRWTRFVVNSNIEPTTDTLLNRVMFFESSLQDEPCFAAQKYLLTTGLTAGAVSFSFAQNSATTDLTALISEGSYLRVEKVK